MNQPDPHATPERAATLQGALDNAYHEHAGDPECRTVEALMQRMTRAVADWLSWEIEGLDTYEIEGEMPGDVLVYRGDVFKVIYGDLDV